jgi:tetratricopeptide (TPR) repeat protein
LTEAQIKWVQPYELPDGRMIQLPKEPYFDPVRKERRLLFPFSDPKTKTFLRIQDLMIENIVLANEWKYPIYFSSTVPKENRHNLDPYLLKEGFVHRIVPNPESAGINVEKSWYFLNKVYRYRGLNDINVTKDENTAGLLMNYSETFLELSNYYAKLGDKNKAKEVLEKGLEVYPDYYRSYIFLSRLYADLKESDKDIEILKEGTKRLENLVRKNPEVLLYYQYLAILYQSQNRFTEAERILLKAFEKNKYNQFTFRALIDLYNFSRQYKKAIDFTNLWLRYNPTDRLALSILSQLKAQSGGK